ncbi:PilZ domain-containing protein [Leptospira borgpetersenii]|uniref:PilZ domain-containing protein n=1 Tax=Leptospira borgpetersenii TaxID=174 RepID=UPI000774CC0F|nr:PilZ domain-containing protein [Leptospira borgpetersenii]MBE8400852.1 PilZ domain-containing protein [Leptospira borgpetersenii serovar Tarassovi]MBE8403984.1 PilZ domain-containing protein [Leptospira borgpetersenii serovar Tarassovi]MBE8406992.1 PilZ domain-containing protein [Leptospira borgpetersenii serovar Tarassovi]MBE8411159.1 PilZ domain-containing protein [Leptospira borgpetersenii serovar Tarassovi]MBE8416543.1 PilZ domain-containing protein [Leptospira borgpetersenii serovar Ta
MRYNRIPNTVTVYLSQLAGQNLRLAENILKGLLHRTDSPIEPGTILELKIGTISLSGTIQIPVKVIRCEKISESEYDLYMNYTEKDFNKIQEIEDLIRDLS